MAQNNNAVPAAVEEPANNNVIELPNEVFGPPDYAPVSFENLEQDTPYLVRMTSHSLEFIDLLLQTTHAENWKTETTVRPILVARRGYKRILSIQKMIEGGLVIADDEEAVEDADGDIPFHVADLLQHDGEVVEILGFSELVDDHGKAEDVFRTFEYATDANGLPVPGEWSILDFQMIFAVGKDFIKMEISNAEYGYVFFKKVEQVGGKRRHTRRRRSIRRRRSTCRQRRTMHQKR